MFDCILITRFLISFSGIFFGLIFFNSLVNKNNEILELQHQEERLFETARLLQTSHPTVYKNQQNI